MRRGWVLGLVVGAWLAGACGGGGTSGPDSGAGGDDAATQHDGVAQQDGAGGQQDGAGGQQDGGGGQQDGSGGQQDGAGGQQDGGGSTCVNHQTAPSSAAPSMAGLSNCSSHHHAFTISGTLFSSATGGSGVGGATVRVKNASTDAVQLQLVTDSAGLFYSYQAVTFPATVDVSSCPDIQTMPTPITSGTCYASGCHSSSQRVHLP
jgi:hypothetical protein